MDHVQQAAVIPVQASRVWLVTARSGKRWVIPKGCLEPGKTAGQIALQEAWEEAGLIGVLHQEPIGSYLYEKSETCYHVLVFLMHVTEVRESWPECSWRLRSWLRPIQAIARVEEQGLRRLLRLVLAADPVALPA